MFARGSKALRDAFDRDHPEQHEGQLGKRTDVMLAREREKIRRELTRLELGHRPCTHRRDEERDVDLHRGPVRLRWAVMVPFEVIDDVQMRSR